MSEITDEQMAKWEEELDSDQPVHQVFLRNWCRGLIDEVRRLRREHVQKTGDAYYQTQGVCEDYEKRIATLLAENKRLCGATS